MLPVRTKVIIAIAFSVGVGAGVLTYLASRSVPQALLTAGAATGGSADLLRQLTGLDPEHPASRHQNNQDDGHDSVEQNTT